MGDGGKYMTKFLGILGLPGGKSNIGHYVLKVLGDKIVTITREISHESINQNAEYGVLLELQNNIDLWENFT